MAWELLPSPTRPPRAQAPALISGPPPTLRAGPDGSRTGPQWLEPSREAFSAHTHSPLRRDPQPSSGRAPPGSSRSPARVYRVRSGPARLLQNNTLQSGFYAPSQGTARLSGSSIPHRVGLQHPRYLTAAPGSTVLNRPAPARESKLQARVHRGHTGPARQLPVTTSVRVLRPAPGDGPHGQVHRPRTGSAC